MPRTPDVGSAAPEVIAAIPPRIRTALVAGSPVGLYLVGGWVRDHLLGRNNHDLDLAVDGDALATARQLATRLGGAVVPLDPERGVYRVVLREPEAGVGCVDLTRLRAPTIERDLALRDFTINAIAVPLAAQPPTLLDPTGGLDDLRRQRLRSAAGSAFHDDPVRLLRGVRFACELGFTWESATKRLALAAAPLLRRAAAERCRDEFFHILASDRAAEGARSLDELGVLTVLLPDLEAARGVSQPSEHYYDVFNHSVQTLAALDVILRSETPNQVEEANFWRALWERLPAASGLREHLDAAASDERPWRSVLKFAGLLHDVSKPETKAVDPDSGRTRFFGHDDLGSRRTAALARSLRLSGREVEYVALLVREHLRPGMLAAPGEAPTRRALYRFFRDLVPYVPDLLLLNLADHAAVRGPLLTLAEWVAHVDYVTWLLRTLDEDEQITRPPRLVTGDDLIQELALAPGPLVGRLLEAIRESQAAGEVTSREAALTLARALQGS